ncbi:MAG: hypothetical protein IJ906_05675 [Oscillospiraceae bacterium]|nr:hypothetical protein [Oscillospiraceae bacterium]
MENVRSTKNRSKARHISVEDCKRLNDMIVGGAVKQGKSDKLNEIEAAMDKRAADIALTISDMFKFMAMSAAILPNMELDTGIMRLKVDDGGVFFEINDPYRMRKAKRDSECFGKEPDDDTDDLDDFDGCDDDEEGLLYDGD